MMSLSMWAKLIASRTLKAVCSTASFSSSAAGMGWVASDMMGCERCARRAVRRENPPQAWREIASERFVDSRRGSMDLVIGGGLDGLGTIQPSFGAKVIFGDRIHKCLGRYGFGQLGSGDSVAT